MLSALGEDELAYARSPGVLLGLLISLLLILLLGLGEWACAPIF